MYKTRIKTGGGEGGRNLKRLLYLLSFWQLDGGGRFRRGVQMAE
jgi:hypothetical protein